MRARPQAGSTTDEWPGFTLVELLIVIVVLGVLAAVVVFSLGGVSASASVASCRADAHIVETAVRAYVTQNGVAPTTADLTGSTNPYLDSFPSSPSFSIVLDHGVVEVAAPTGSAPVPATSPSACAGLSSARSGGTTTTTTSSTTTTTLPPSPPVSVTVSSSSGTTSRDVVRLTFSRPVTSWSVSIQVGTANGEFYRGMSPGGRAYSPHHTSPRGGPVSYTWTYASRSPVKPRPLNVVAYFSLPRGTHGPHDFASDAYSWSATASGVVSSGSGHF